MPVSVLVTFCLSLLAAVVDAACECGYITGEGEVFTHYIHNDFTRAPESNITQALADWTIEKWTSTPKNSSLPGSATLIPRQNLVDNVYIKGGELHLRQRGYTAGQNSTVNGTKVPVSGAELRSKQADILHGSFRAKYRVTKLVNNTDSTGGAVSGFFLYYDDANESDIEILTKEPGFDTVHYTNHPSSYANGTMIPGASLTERLRKPYSECQEHRIDWNHNTTGFYQDGALIRRSAINVPKRPSAVIVNLWADNGTWSGPPSTTDTYMSIEYMTFYFNTSDSASGRDARYNDVCAAAGGPTRAGTVCGEAQGNQLLRGYSRPKANGWKPAPWVKTYRMLVGHRKGKKPVNYKKYG